MSSLSDSNATLPAALTMVAALVAAVLAATAAPADAARQRTADEAAAERHLVELHNHHRAGASRSALHAVGDLAELARAWSDEMARTGTFKHNPSASQQICCWSAWGENIAWAGPVDVIGGWQATADRIMRGWLDSPGHRDNLLSASFDEVGVGVSLADNGRMYATAVFRRSDGTTQPAVRPAPEARGIDNACPSADVPATGFDDVGPSQQAAVDCLAWWQVAQGTSTTRFTPQAAVTRGQLAAFLARALEASGASLPAAASDLTDVADSVHADAIARLAAVGVVGGYADGTFRPHETVTRAQMASMLVEAAEHLAAPLPAPTRDWFVDDAGTHERAINQLADAGWATGDGDGAFGAADTLERGHLAVFLARWLDTMVADHGAPLP